MKYKKTSNPLKLKAIISSDKVFALKTVDIKNKKQKMQRKIRF